MGKKNKKLKHKKLTEHKFIQRYCRECNLCMNLHAKFCYKQFYKKNPILFIENIYPQLLKYKFLSGNGLSGKETNLTIFSTVIVKKIFCLNCPLYLKKVNKRCHKLLECVLKFQKQKLSGTNTTAKVNNAKKQSKQPIQFTFITNDNKKWKDKINEILHEDNN